MQPPECIVQLFLNSLAETASIAKACRASGIERPQAYQMRKDDAGFAAAWDVALENGTDALEDEAVRRAMDGVEKNIYHQGNIIATERVYSDGLLTLLLRARRPERYRENTQLNVSGHITLEALVLQAVELRDAREPKQIEQSS